MRDLDVLEPEVVEDTLLHVDPDWIACRIAEQGWHDPVGESIVDRVGLCQAWRSVGKRLFLKGP
jgi:hypothetical protein